MQPVTPLSFIILTSVVVQCPGEKKERVPEVPNAK